MDEALQMLADFLETIPYCDNTHYEGHYQQMLYIIFALLTDYNILVEQHTAKGQNRHHDGDCRHHLCDGTEIQQECRGGSRPDRGKALCRCFQDERQEGGEDGLELLCEGRGEYLEWVIA